MRPDAELTILGSGGWFPAHDRQTATALIRDGDSAIMIDAGTGVGRLLEHPRLLSGVTRLDILLTHFHLDHIAGLTFLPAIGAIEQTTIWGPGRELYDAGTAELLTWISREPFYPVSFEQQQIEVREIPAGELELGGTRIHTRHQDRHSAPTLGLRFEDRLAWITDTAYDPAGAEFGAGCSLIAHEAWFLEREPRNPDIHSSAAQAGAIAQAAGAERLLLIHLPPFSRYVDELVLEASATAPGVTAAEDALTIGL